MRRKPKKRQERNRTKGKQNSGNQLVATTNIYMKYHELQIQTQRDAPNNARTEGFAFLVRAGYLTRENVPTKLGEYTLSHLDKLAQAHGRSFAHTDYFVISLSLPILNTGNEIFFPITTGSIDIAHCQFCEHYYTERAELARFAKVPLAGEELFPLEKVPTPDCNTIEALANFLNIPKEKTAKALMYTRENDKKFIFVVVRGDMQLSEAKLKNNVGNVRPATQEEMAGSGAVAGYASPIGLKHGLIVVDDLIPQSRNLVAGANDTGYHLKNTNYRRDYTADIVADLVQVRPGDSCLYCGRPLEIVPAELLATYDNVQHFENILLALAETHHDEKGLILPRLVAPFVVYLMHVPGKEMDTRGKAEEIYNKLEGAGVSVLFDDRNERAGVKFNDADLIGCPVRVTVGEKRLKEGMVELKLRNVRENQLVPVDEIIEKIVSILK